jgi:hypothetical protein
LCWALSNAYRSPTYLPFILHRPRKGTPALNRSWKSASGIEIGKEDDPAGQEESAMRARVGREDHLCSLLPEIVEYLVHKLHLEAIASSPKPRYVDESSSRQLPQSSTVEMTLKRVFTTLRHKFYRHSIHDRQNLDLGRHFYACKNLGTMGLTHGPHSLRYSTYDSIQAKESRTPYGTTLTNQSRPRKATC